MLILGDARRLPLRDGSVHCVVTSPPYWGLRDYKAGGGMIGLEPTPEAHVAALVGVFREVRRVLRDDGVCFVNYGDAYATSPPGNTLGTGRASSGLAGNTSANIDRRQANHHGTVPSGFKPGDLLGLAWRLAFALQADGWWLRSAIVWAKGVSFRPEWSGSVMPESVNGIRWERCRVKMRGGSVGRHGYEVRNGLPGPGHVTESNVGERDNGAAWRDCPGCPKCAANDGLVLRRSRWRPTTAHEYVFLLAKSERYYADAQAVAEAGIWPAGTRAAKGGGKREGNRRGEDTATYSGTRNPRSVWAIGTAPFAEAHFATFPPELVRPMIRAATARQNCPHCGAQWARVVNLTRMGFEPSERCLEMRSDGTGSQRTTLRGQMTSPPSCETLGFRATCPCPGNDGSAPALVLDPFSGSGTVAQVAVEEGRRAIGVDLAPHYQPIAARRNRAIEVRLPM